MKSAPEAIRNLEQIEAGEIRPLQCYRCGQRSFVSPERLWRHELDCVERFAEFSVVERIHSCRARADRVRQEKEAVPSGGVTGPWMPI